MILRHKTDNKVFWFWIQVFDYIRTIIEHWYKNNKDGVG